MLWSWNSVCCVFWESLYWGLANRAVCVSRAGWEPTAQQLGPSTDGWRSTELLQFIHPWLHDHLFSTGLAHWPRQLGFNLNSCTVPACKHSDSWAESMFEHGHDCCPAPAIAAHRAMLGPMRLWISHLKYLLQLLTTPKGLAAPEQHFFFHSCFPCPPAVSHCVGRDVCSGLRLCVPGLDVPHTCSSQALQGRT